MKRSTKVCTGFGVAALALLAGLASAYAGTIKSESWRNDDVDWNSVLATLSLAILPIVVICVIVSRQLISGLTVGAVK